MESAFGKQCKAYRQNKCKQDQCSRFYQAAFICAEADAERNIERAQEQHYIEYCDKQRHQVLCFFPEHGVSERCAQCIRKIAGNHIKYVHRKSQQIFAVHISFDSGRGGYGKI